jgi:2'-5' RNA ligase
LGAVLERTLAALPRFRLDLGGMGAFPSERHANVLWAGLDDVDGGLAAVAAVVEAVTAGFGFAPEQRPFTGHVTVGRAKGRGVDARAALARFAAHSFGATVVDEVRIYESRLGRGPNNDGSTYVLRSRAMLGPAASN